MPDNQQKTKARPAETCDLHPSIVNSNDDVAKTQAKNKTDDILATKERQTKQSDIAELDSESKTSDAETTNEPGMEMEVEVEEPEDNETADGIDDDKSSRIDTDGADKTRIESHGDAVRCVFDSVREADRQIDRRAVRQSDR